METFIVGYSLSWIAVKGLSGEELRLSLGLRATGKQGSYGEHPLVGRALQDGWHILIADSSDDPIAAGGTLARLSRGCRAVACSVEEHVMFSSASFWNKGRKTWSVRHRGENGVFDLASTGKLPDYFPAMREEFVERQKSAGGEDADTDHVFDLPIVLAKRIAGFRHDEAAEGTPGDAYEILARGRMERIRRAIKAWAPWLYIAGAIAITVAAGIAASEILKLVKTLVP